MSNLDKSKYYNILKEFNDKWDKELFLYFDEKQVDSTAAQLMKSRRMLDQAKTEEDCKVVAERIRKLASWIDYNKKTE